MENQQHEEEETQRQKFETLNYYTMFTRGTGTAITITACIPTLIGIYFALMALVEHLDSDTKSALTQLVKSLTFLGISFSLFYAAGLLMIISELIQCFLAIEENTYQAAQNTSSNQPPSSN